MRIIKALAITIAIIGVSLWAIFQFLHVQAKKALAPKTEEKAEEKKTEPINTGTSNYSKRRLTITKIHNLMALTATKDMWQGMTGVEGRFIKFKDDVSGIRAGLQSTITRYNRGIKTLDQIFAKENGYAPAGDGNNNPEAYKKHVSKIMGIGTDVPIFENHLDNNTALSLFAEAIIRKEVGKEIKYVDLSDIEKAILTINTSHLESIGLA